MKFQCTLEDCTPDYRNGGYLVVLHSRKDIRDQIDSLKNVELDAEVKKHSERRGLNANSYFHVLIGEIARVTGTSLSRAKNDMIGMYGQIEYLDDEPYVITSPAEPEQMYELEVLHTKCIGTTVVQIRRGGFLESEVQNMYQVYRGSHTYNTVEMSRLIEATAQEARALGIDTMTPAERRRLYEAWEVYLEKHGKKIT